MRVLRDDGIEKALSGATSIEEVARVTEARVDIGWEEEKKPVEKEVRVAREVPTPKEAETQTVNLNEYSQRIASWLSSR